MEFNQFKEDLQQLLIEGKTREAIQRLLNVYDNLQGEYHDEVIVLAGRLKRLKDKEMAGVLDNEDADRQTNSIKYDLLQIIDSLHQDPAVAKYFGLSTPTSPITTPKNRTTLPLFIGGLLTGLLVVFGAFYFFGGSVEDTDNTPKEQVETVEQQEVTIPKAKEQEQPRNTSTTQPKEAKPTQPEPEKKVTTPNPPVQVAESSNNSFTTATTLTLGQSTAGKLTSGSNFFQFKTGNSYRNKVIIKWTPVNTSFKAIINLYNAKRERVEQKYNPSGDALEYAFFAKPNTTYFIEVKPYQSSQGDYELNVLLEAFKAQASTEKEPNNTSEVATFLRFDQPMSGLIEPNQRDIDFFEVQVDANKSAFIVEVTPVSPDMRIELTVYDERGYSMGKARAKNKGAIVEMPVKIRGTIYRAEVKGAVNTWGDYTIKAFYD